ncbi:histidine kinase [Pseudomonas sp. Leaf127]|uniref:sensor histidine kinase n=1 Tax=Pseudomonas sp. Leaf127 TaxID=1736267 RepID=UPI0007033207|nr:sensor histidine kinase [Pseudomonas sp. Leaf127]KQQ56260.1 histidine kinase [Pseudomonas sp. Leaf127]
MSSPPHDPASALAIRAQYRQAQSRAARLRLLVDTGQQLTGQPPDTMRQQVLQRACAFVAMDHGLLLEWPPGKTACCTASLGSHEHLGSLIAHADTALRQPAWLEAPDTPLNTVLQLPLRGADDRTFGLLLLANSLPISAPDSEDIESLQLLATLLAAHLENDRLLQALVTRERSMSELVHRLFTAQEDERKRMAYDLHDGLAQTLAGLHQRLQGFAGRCPPLPAPQDNDLENILDLARHCVGEARELIGGLRPSVLDDFGLWRAIDKEADRLRDAGIDVQWQARSHERLPAPVEIALFRIAQEGINNVLKHAGAQCVELGLQRHPEQVALHLSDDGCGFDIDSLQPHHPARSLGLVTMQERASLLGGHFSYTRPSAGGTCLQTVVPLAPAQAVRA